jgi:phytol kinase
MLNSPWTATILTLIAALLWLRVCDYAAHRGWMSSQVARKIIHIGTGPIFVLCWFLFPDSPSSRLFAATVPLLITGQFAAVGMGWIQDEAAVKAMTRTGDPKEILRGPLYYGLVFVVVTIWFWKDSPTGIVALMLMCGGDGMADILGRRFGNTKLPWTKDKSWWGSTGMLLGGFILAAMIVWGFVEAQVFTGTMNAYLIPLALIALAGTAIESLPFQDIDNITVTGTAILLGTFLF